jgi:hypothetical protein
MNSEFTECKKVLVQEIWNELIEGRRTTQRLNT